MGWKKSADSVVAIDRFDIKEKIRTASANVKTKGFEMKPANGGFYLIHPDGKRSRVMGATTILKYIEGLT